VTFIPLNLLKVIARLAVNKEDQETNRCS